MTMMSKTAIGIAAGICGTLFLGYCIYFDRQRRSDPNYRKKLRERRKINSSLNNARSRARTTLPDLQDHEAVQMFFLQEVQLGEELLGQGDVQGGVEHLGNAVAVCGQPNQLLQVLQQTLPPTVFHLLLQRLPTVSQNIMSRSSGPAAAVIDDDVE